MSEREHSSSLCFSEKLKFHLSTTFVSAIFALANSLSLQEYLARWLSDYMTYNTGVTVIFESAIVPKWGSSLITFKNVYVSCRPDEGPSSAPVEGGKKQVKAATAKPPSPIPFLSSAISPETYLAARPAPPEDNYTMYDVNIDQLEVSLSFMRWLDGKGLVKDVRIKGVRGVVDRRSVWWDLSKPLDPADFRHATQKGDFEFESFHVEDALVTVYQPGLRPYNVSIFNMIVGPFRKKWLFYDLMSAEGITGQFDNCLFSLHMPQKLGKSVEKEGGMIKRMASLPTTISCHTANSQMTGPIQNRRSPHRACPIRLWLHPTHVMANIRQARRCA